MKYKRMLYLVLFVIVVTLLCGMCALFPPVTERLAWHYDQWRVRIRYALNPPEEAIFIPDEQVAEVVQKTLQLTATTEITATPDIEKVATQQPSEPQATAAQLPPQVMLDFTNYQDQHGLWNYCAPANLAMALSYWGWQGDRVDTGSYLKPNEGDKNVMPYEMANYVEEMTDLSVILRYGGTLDLIKGLLANGFPVLVEKGVYIRETTTGKESWMGHYNFVTGYDDNNQQLIIQDSFYEPDYRISYDQFIWEWRSFNYVLLVVYPENQWNKLGEVMGEYLDQEKANRIAYNKANEEITVLNDMELFFAWYNRGTSLVNLQDYVGAAAAYDEAFLLYPSLSKDRRPWRITWYQTGPYFAYYYAGRYQDVLELTDQTLDIPQPYLEENYYWRARAKSALGDRDGAIEDLKTSLDIHPDFVPSLDMLQTLGVEN